MVGGKQPVAGDVYRADMLESVADAAAIKPNHLLNILVITIEYLGVY
jgi:hypothetical protein